MNSPILAGLFGGWAAVQIAVGVFFIQVYAARRRELEYLLFGVVCLGVALTDAGFAVAGAISGVEQWPLTQKVTHVGAIIATVVNLHFVLQFVAPWRIKALAPVVYAIGAALAAVLLLDAWWVPGTLRTVESALFGVAMRDVRAQPSVLGVIGYAFLLLIDGLSLLVLVAGYRGGRRDVLGAVVGLFIVMACGANDVLTISLQLATPPLFSYGFLIYGFGVADTLLARYRRSAEELEVTARDLRRATDELTNSYLELSSVQEELFRRRQLASVGELAASIAHEVRNPLAVIVNAAATLKRVTLAADDRNTLFGIIEEEITRLNNIVTELLRYARPVNVQREEVILAEMVKALAEGIGPTHTLGLVRPSQSEAETVWADPSLLRLALQNLIDNARQATPGGGAIDLSIARERVGGIEGHRIDVTDGGHGMDARTLNRALDPFFSTRPSGTGLGLPITVRIVEAHGGRVDVVSNVGEGTTVSLFLPAKGAERLSGHRLSPVPRA